jgi:geranylgeranyl diphosphate synthase type I
MTAALPPDGIHELLQPALRKAVDDLPARLRDVAGYHLGWLDEQGRPHSTDSGRSTNAGKAVRPAITLLCAQAVGSEPASALPGAMAVELVHSFSLLHDDVMDGDTERRHRPTVWALFGVPMAILAGDALLTLAMQVMERTGDPAAISTLTAAVQDLITGQTQDVDFERRTDVTLAECLQMEAGKTAALMRCSAALGARLGGADEATVRRLGEFGDRLGMAFQLVDDLLGIWGSPEVTGKPVLADLRARKNSVPVVAALESGTPEAAALREIYRRPSPPAEHELPGMAELIERCGASAWTREQAGGYLDSALSSLDAATSPGPAHTALETLARFVVGRDR